MNLDTERRKIEDTYVKESVRFFSNPISKDEILLQKVLTGKMDIEIIAENVLCVAVWHSKKIEQIIDLFADLINEFNISKQDLLNQVEKISTFEDFNRITSEVAFTKIKLKQNLESE